MANSASTEAHQLTLQPFDELMDGDVEEVSGFGVPGLPRDIQESLAMFLEGHKPVVTPIAHANRYLSAVVDVVVLAASRHGRTIPKIQLLNGEPAVIGGLSKCLGVARVLPKVLECLTGSIAGMKTANVAMQGFCPSMSIAEFQAIRPYFGTASGAQSSVFRKLELVLGLRERNLHRFDWELPELAEARQTLTREELFEATSPRMPLDGRDKFSAYSPDAVPDLIATLVRPSMRDIIYGLFQSDATGIQADVLKSAKKLDSLLTRMREMHGHLAQKYLGDSHGTAAASKYLNVVNDSTQPGYWRLAFPCLEAWPERPPDGLRP